MSDRTVGLTELGSQKSLEDGGRGPKKDVLTALYVSGGSLPLEELMDEVNLEPEPLAKVLKSLINQGYVRELP